MAPASPWFNDLAPWMEQEWGVCVVLCMFSYAPYTAVDTSSEKTIFQGLAKRNLIDPPMVRQARGIADNFLSDIERIVKDYQIDCVILPGHMGHKDGSASISLMRDKCRDIGVPFLYIGCDQFDRRYTTIDEIKDRISSFCTAMDLGEAVVPRNVPAAQSRKALPFCFSSNYKQENDHLCPLQQGGNPLVQAY